VGTARRQGDRTAATLGHRPPACGRRRRRSDDRGTRPRLGLAGHAHTNEELVAAARAEIARLAVGQQDAWGLAGRAHAGAEAVLQPGKACFRRTAMSFSGNGVGATALLHLMPGRKVQSTCRYPGGATVGQHDGKRPPPPEVEGSPHGRPTVVVHGAERGRAGLHHGVWDGRGQPTSVPPRRSPSFAPPKPQRHACSPTWASSCRSPRSWWAKSSTPLEVIDAMVGKYPSYGNRYTLCAAAFTQFPS
jgi:hypothetical protein